MRFLKKFFLILIIFVLISLGYLAWLKTGPFYPAKVKSIHIIPVPIAFASGKFIWINDFEKYTNQPVQYSVEKLEDFYKYYAILNKYSVISPDDDRLKIIYLRKNFESSGVENTYKIIRTGLENGKTFESLNQEYDQDTYSKEFYGDLGFLESDQLLPEILKELDNMQPGDIAPIPSRYGWHIIKLEGIDRLGAQNSQRYHIKQIFLPINGFNNWVESETKKINIIKIIKFK